MGPLPHGPVTAHIQSSKGPDTNVMKFYTTEHSAKYGHEGFQPRVGQHSGTGYQSNFRPGVYYSRKLDELDNPVMGRLLTDNYNSITKLHFKATRGANGKDAFPKDVYIVKSGFVRDIPRTIPTYNQVKLVNVDKRYSGTVYPKARPLLHKIGSKDPTDLENAGYGPEYMSTENHSKFLGTPSQRMDLSSKSVGPKEESGFTHAYNDEPVTFRPNEAYRGLMPGWWTYRPTGNSIMKTDFRPSRYPHGNEPLTTIAKGAERDTGYTREIKPRAEFTVRQNQVYTKLEDVHPLVQERIKKQDPAEYTNMECSKEYPSMTISAFKGRQRNDPTLTEKLGRITLGTKEDTGFTENNCKFVETAETLQTLKRFNTEYQNRFYDKTPGGEARMGNTRGNVMEQVSNGFTKSTIVHDYGPHINTTEQLRKLHPYVARSVKARDPYYDDHTHDSKLKPLTA